jgi:hypothetical protein
MLQKHCVIQSRPDRQMTMQRADWPIPARNPSGPEPFMQPVNWNIRGATGVTFDSVAKNVWHTENGPASNDQINF